MFIKARDLSRAGHLTAQWVFELPVTMTVFFIISFCTNQYFESLARELSSSEQGPWPAQIGEFGDSLIEGFVLLLVGGYFLTTLQGKTTWRAFFKSKLAPLAAESLRALTRILLWSLALLIPGFVMYCRLSLVPFVVFLDPTYSTKPDAVARSLELTRHCWIRLSLLIVVLTAFDAIFEMGPSLLEIDNLYLRIVFDLSGFLFSLYSFVYLYVIFENLRTGET